MRERLPLVRLEAGSGAVLEPGLDGNTEGEELVVEGEESELISEEEMRLVAEFVRFDFDLIFLRGRPGGLFLGKADTE